MTIYEVEWLDMTLFTRKNQLYKCSLGYFSSFKNAYKAVKKFETTYCDSSKTVIENEFISEPLVHQEHMTGCHDEHRHVINIIRRPVDVYLPEEYCERGFE